MELLAAGSFVCAGSPTPFVENPKSPRAAKSAQFTGTPGLVSAFGTRRAAVLYAQFRDENSGSSSPPAWAVDLFNPDRPGSFAHFYHTMSFGQLQVSGEVLPRLYESAQAAAFYLADDSTEFGDYPQFVLEVLGQADAEVDFARFDNDGADGVANSGDDDGYVDALFIILDSVPRNFFLGAATGIGGLGFEGVFTTDDVGANGQPVRIFPTSGTLQQGRNFVETVGSMCHEYGHVLGLPDLIDTNFLRQKDAVPEEDSAGIGSWGLMGWGALGWKGDDGPNSFSAWSRMQLGWAKVIDISQPREEMRLPDVDQEGAVYRIAFANRAFFLVENRRRAGSYYNRNIPGEGLLIWHVERDKLVDLECADGRWLDAGYPAGVQADVRNGGDNLDFWAHDRDYARDHAGNLGDATDPFDGVHFATFSPETNPASYSNDGTQSIDIEDIRFEGEVAIAAIETAPVFVSVRDLQLVDENGDGRIVSGEEVEVRFKLGHERGLKATDLKAVLFSDDPFVEILKSVAVFPDLDVDRVVFGTVGGGPRFRLTSDFINVHTADLRLEIRANGGTVGGEEVVVDALSPLSAETIYLVVGRNLLKSVDGGKNWESIDSGLTGRPWFSDVAADPLDDKVIYAATPWGVFRGDRRGITAVVEEGGNLPAAYSLEQNYPNPFNSDTVITYRLPEQITVGLTIYNILGQPVRELVAEIQHAGQHRIVWDGADDDKRSVGSGVYFYRLQAGEYQQTRRLVLLK